MSHSNVNQILHIMWSTQNLKYTFKSPLKEDLYAYITAIVKSKDGRVFAVGGSNDHIHLLALVSPDISISEFIKHIKAYTSKWLKTRETVDPLFSWQNGYLSISIHEDQLDRVCAYIRSDELRHQSISYSEELLDLLTKLKIEFNPKYYMQNSFSKMFIHTIWSTDGREPFLIKKVRQDLYKKISELASVNDAQVHEIGGIEDHVHLLMELPRDKALSDLIKDIKTSSTHWLKTVDAANFRDFSWQTGYGAFTISYSNLDIVKSYIQNQEEHHRKCTYQEEWNELLMMVRS